LQRLLVRRTNLLGTASNTSLEVTQPVPVLDPTQLLSLNCFVLGDDLKKVFTVEVEKTRNVSILKDRIKEKKAPHLDRVAASDLDLFEVSLPRDGDVDAILQNANREPLDSLLPLSQVFPHVKENHLHVVVQSPIDGELSEIF
jgi:Crinkler effector protein N-terminal domain